MPTPYNYQAVQASGSWAGMNPGGGPSADTPGAETISSAGPAENSYRWATVTQLSPLRIRLDGENIPLPITPESLVNPLHLRVATGVWVQLYGKRVIVLGAHVGGSDPEVPIGGLVPWSGAAAPNANWLIANGAAVSRTTYSALFAVCGTTYGTGDGSTTFNLPSLTNRVPVGSGGTYTRGQTGGAATVALSTAELASHTHSFSGSLSGSASSAGDHSHSLSGSVGSAGSHSHSVGNQGGRSDLLAGGGTTAATSGGGSTGSDGDHGHSLSGTANSTGSHTHGLSGTASGTTGGQGSGTAHENMQPFVAMPYIIRAL